MSKAKEEYYELLEDGVNGHWLQESAKRYIQELEKKLNPDCSTCKWNKGKHMGGIGSSYPCDNCMVNQYESIEEVLRYE